MHLFCQLLTAFLPEDIVSVFGQFGGCKPCHVLNEAEDGHIHLLIPVHIDTLAGISQRHLLWCRYDDGTSDGQRLEQRQVDIGHRQ